MINPNTIYFINLDRDKDRKEFFINNFKNLYEEENIIHFNGVDGYNNEEVNYAIKYLNLTKGFKNIISKGQKGVYLSHLTLLQFLYENCNDEYFHILEDDAKPSKNYKIYLEEVINYINKNNINCDFLQIGNQCQRSNFNKEVYKINNEITLTNGLSFCLHSYIISRKGIKHLLDYFLVKLKILWVIDIDILKSNINSYMIFEEKYKDILKENIYLARSMGLVYQGLIRNSIHNDTEEDYNSSINGILNDNYSAYKFNHFKDYENVNTININDKDIDIKKEEEKRKKLDRYFLKKNKYRKIKKLKKNRKN